MPENLIIHHGHCPDGYGSAWWLAKFLDPDPVLFAASYSKTEVRPDCTGKNVYILDFSYDAETTCDIAVEANSLLVLDHHESAVKNLTHVGAMDARVPISVHLSMDDFLEKGSHGPYDVVLDMNRSGAGLTGEFVRVAYGFSPPWFFPSLQDRDLWKFEYGDTPAIFAGITSFDQTIEDWDWINEHSVEVTARGIGIEMYRQTLIKSILETAFLTNIAGYEVWCVAAPYAVGSDVAGALAERDPDRPFAAYYVVYGGRVKFGLRSRGEGMDVSKVAEKYGGGGHVHASGFEWLTPTIQVYDLDTPDDN